MTVFNPATNASTTVSALIRDPAGTPTANDVAFVRTADGYVFLVKDVNEFIYNNDPTPASFKIISKDTTAKTVELQGIAPPSTQNASLGYQILYTDFQTNFLGEDTPGEITVPVPVVGGDGVKILYVGRGGSNGRNGALFVPPNAGGHGESGPANSYTLTFDISAGLSPNPERIGLEIGSVGGKGGNGGNSYASFWSGKSGGNGGAGGPVTVVTNAGVQISTRGADKHGIYAYSRSGQGGSGGSGYAAPGGGAGGHSNNGGNVTVTNNGIVITQGNGAFGIYGLSVSNNGGGGGDTWGIVGESGSGSYGGNGGIVTITNSATGEIYTAGNVAHGIVAQSIGGSGGSSGTSGNLILSLNGAADDGGSGGEVNVYNYGLISTTGSASLGILAQSIGGGGGSGGTSGGLFSLGGSGSYGGSAGAVTVRNYSSGRIATTNTNSDGIMAQSIGGSGGSGTDSFGLVAVGGRGSRAGDGGTVTVENFGSISTGGDFARGIVAQSIGGGGGDGGSSGGLVSVGGSGNGGGIGKLVTITNGGSITTEGIGSIGILAQSIGGGGGNGGGSGSVGVFTGVAVGGNGGKGGAGGNVNVVLQGADANTASVINTTGDRSIALFVQSVGGGGGNGGGAIQVSAGFAAAASFAVGGNGGEASNGGIVSLTKGVGKSIIETNGKDSTGVFLQSVGGGGGNGGYAVAVAVSGGPASGSISVGVGGRGGSAGAGGDVTAGTFAANGTMTASGFDGSILTTGDRSTGFLAQSVGGGGGNGGLAVAAAGAGSPTISGSISVGLGGKGGSGGAGGKVQVGLDGNITTQGNSATALLVQSVGGGGGNGGGSIAAGLAGGVGAGTVGLSLGGDGGAGSTGGVVNVVTTAGTIKTEGAHSSAIVIQSIGGGGGNGGYAVSASAAGGSVGAGSVNIGLGGSGGTGGTGGNVTANLQSNVETTSVKRALDPATNAPIPEKYMSDSTGVLVQSVGGGGGNGGFSVAAGGAGAGTGSGAVSLGLGGNGAQGGTGGIVNVRSTGTIQTKGDRSAGLVAQSIGGGGGNGGYSVSVAGSGAGVGSGAIAVGLGGSGGSGNIAQAVTVHTLTGRISTEGADSIGILAQSIGGGGGNGGFNVSVAGSGAGTGGGAISVGLGGNGGTGAHAGDVNLTVANAVSTLGKNSAAVVAQSIGGGGGSGGFNVSVALSGAGTGSGAVSVGLGGSGAGGGNGGIVIVNTSGNITTEGDNSNGILAQSIGGGGGNGGFDVSVSASGGSSGSGAVSVGLGGHGAGGGTAGNVTLTVNNNVSTKGKKSTGIVAQSVGGGGGNGGFNITAPISGSSSLSGAIGIGLGGSAGTGGDAGILNSNVTGTITTEKEGSGGLLVQSLGGGGGNGGMSIVGALSFSGSGSGAVAVGLGGSGGSGGNANNVTSILTGSVYTEAKDSFGVIAQSMGGGGGNGGMSVNGAISLAKTGSGALAFGLGGAGGDGGDAGDTVTNTVTGYVQTKGNNSIGVLAQSLGGGGGNGGLNVSGIITASKEGSDGLAIGIGGLGGDGGIGKTVINTVTGGVVTAGNDSAAIVAQSLGGGGGNGGLNVTGTINATKDGGGTLGIGVGGFGGDGGNAGDVTSTVTATSAYNNLIGTIGHNSSAVVAQSIGGGGGNGGLNVTGAVNITGKNGAAIGVGLGGFGGGAGNAGVVTANVTGNIITQGNQSHGILAQSVGGAGGNGGTNVTGTLAFAQSPSTTAAVSLGVGGFGGGGGTAGAVNVSYSGTLIARPGVFVDATPTGPAHIEYVDGAGSNGIAAQSIGGGGGNGGLNVSGGIAYEGGTGSGYGIIAGVGGFGGDGGDAGATTVTVTGGNSITGYGAGHSGILAQSIGGGGGAGGMNVTGGITSDSALLVGVGGFGSDAGTGSTVTVNATTDVFASALNSQNFSSAALMAQSIGGGGGNGGMNVTGGLAIDKQAGVPSVNLGIGGFGGSGAASGDVNVTLTGNATSVGSWIHGIMAQSIGGGGGNGALNAGGQFNFADSENSGGKKDISIIAGVGGYAGEGANAGNVTVTNSGIVSTIGDHARGVAAQSIGGGGGTGGMNVTAIFAKNSSPISVGIGGDGGGGGDAGTVTVTRGSSSLAAGKVTTDGTAAHAIEASSIGGGGGDAGMNFNVGYSKVGEGSATPGFAANFSIGGGGADAGDGSNATVTNFSAIETKKDYAYGILAQSIGGGGGNASFNISVTHAGASDSAGDKLYNKPNQNMGFSLAIGGDTGDGGDGGTVIVNQTGNLTTIGKAAIGILAQSVGGGGGNAGFDIGFVKADGGKAGITLGQVGGTGGLGGTVELNYSGILNTTGEMAFGLLAQSIGNGGGNSSSTTVTAEVPSDQTDLGETRAQSVGVAVGLEGGVGGAGGMVTLNSDGTITTRGRRAHAVFAQSIGGGGGNGGKASTFGISAAIAAVTLGGEGGRGGLGGLVNLTNSAVVQTFGEEAVGLLAQSIGGGGGTGGSAYSGGTKTGDTGITVGIGGNGGEGMDGGTINLINTGIVVTRGLAAHAVLAQSIGGGGGDGGSAISMILGLNTASPNATSATRVAVNVGGNGDVGGDGGAVNVTNSGGIGTYEKASVGIFAQSIGGGGGNGSSVLTSSLSGSSGNNLSISVGGSGGSGGTGGTVTVKNQKTTDPDSAKIITLADKAHGILAMSVGGGGGTGSNASAINAAARGVSGPTAAHQLSISVGGNGGSGGTGGYVDVFNDGFIETRGDAAHGIIAQSIGGGGGSGGMATSGDLAFGSDSAPANGKTFQIAVGGQGGSGNAGGDVLVTNSGTIQVLGDASYGIYAQSVGGGGGDGGFAAAFSRNLLKNPKGNFLASVSTFALGGFGGTGGDGGDVTVNHTGSILSSGDNAYGIFAQSISGGGGNSAMSISSPVWMATNFTLNAILGGTGSSGTAGTVTINTTGTISMTGANSVAQFSQSVNGGGGNANLFMDFSQQAQELGDNGLPLPGNGGVVDTALGFITSHIQMGADAVTGAAAAVVNAIHSGSLHSDGDNSGGGLLQSVGGGGGRGTQTINIAHDSQVDLVVQIGGTQVSDSSGGNVTYTQNGDISTRGNQSTGIGVQSIGGGGGTQYVTLRTAPSASAFSAFALFAFPSPPATNATLGGDGGVNNHGGTINTTYGGAAMTTSGDRSTALLEQSIGAGGGTTFIVGASALNVDIGGRNGASGNGGDVTVQNIRDIGTNGTLSHGIVLQSIGGGGGAIFTDLDPSLIAVIPNTANSGNGGNIDLTQTGNIFIQGPRSTGIILQSLGGGGGLVDDVFAGTAGGIGNSGTITLLLNGSILATGAGSNGVFAQSQGSGTQGNIQMTLAAAQNLIFGTGGTGVRFSGGATNLFTNNGLVAGLEGVNGWAFRGEEGDETVQNNSAFAGSADFGTGTNLFNNAANAELAMGTQFFLGAAAGSRLTNDGNLRVGGTGLAQHAEMTGNFTQTSTGTSYAELDFGTDVVDNVSMTGAADLAGIMDVALLNPQLIPIGSFEKVLYHADDGVTPNGMTLRTAPSVVIRYRLFYPPTGVDAMLGYDVNFNPPGSNFGRNLVEVGGYFNRIQTAGSSPELASTIIRLIYEPTLEGYRGLLSQLGPDFYGEHQAEMLRGSQRFGETVLEGGLHRFYSRRQTIWFDFVGSNALHSAYDDYKTVNQQTMGLAVGFESVLTETLSAGIAFSLEENYASGYGGRWSAEGNSERIGAVLRYASNGTEIAGLLAYGWNHMRSSRLGNVGAPFDTNVSRNLETFTAMVRFAHEFSGRSFSVKPRLDVGVTRLAAAAATESGGGATSLDLREYDEAHVWVRPAVTVRKAILVGKAAKLVFRGELGYQYFLSGNDTYVRAGFVGAPGGLDPMNVPIDLGSMATLSIGAQLLLMSDDLSIGLYYTKAFSENYQLDLLNLRVDKSF